MQILNYGINQYLQYLSYKVNVELHQLLLAAQFVCNCVTFCFSRCRPLCLGRNR